jgi:putative ABC transport system substrate-binding protein
MNFVKAIALILIVNAVLPGPCLYAQPSGSTADDRTIAMITWRGETDAEKGFVDGVRQNRPEIAITRFHAGQDMKRLERIIAQIRQHPVDLIYVFGTTATQTVLRRITKIPVVFNIVSEPVAAGIIQSWEHSGNNAVGVSNQVPLDNQFKALKKVIPFKRLGIIYNPREPNSLIQRDIAFQLQQSLAFRLIDFKIAFPSEMPLVLSTLKGAVDAVFIPADSLMNSMGRDLGRHINEFKLPSLCTVETLVKDKDNGLLMCMQPSYYQLGLLAAKKAERVLQGERPSDIPSSCLEFFQIFVNMKTARRIGVQIPMSILIIANTIVR